jgi:tripartite-type tricarboxylate transporter receptor subunit TctC
VLSGEAKAMVGSVASTIAFVKAGRLRAIATTAPKQSKLLPNVPTIAASGYPGFDVTVWFAFLVPAGTPKHVVERLRADTAKVLQQTDVQAAMVRQGLEPETSTPSELAARVKKEAAMWSGIIRELGIRAE